jgi:crossover junction endodeoxyribonuclease RusA
MIEITLPWPDKVLNPNVKKSWYVKNRAAREAREIGLGITFGVMDGQDVPEPNVECEAQYMFYPPDRRKRDIDNCLAMMKPYQDGICDALGVDDSLIKRTVLEWGEVVKGGKVVLRLEEMA